MHASGPDKVSNFNNIENIDPKQLAKSSVGDKSVKGYLTRNLTRILGTVEWKTYKEFKEFVGSLADTQEKIEALKMISAKMKEAINEAKKDAESKPLSKSVQKSTNKRIERMERMCAEIQQKIFESPTASKPNATTSFDFEKAIEELDAMNEKEGVDVESYYKELEEIESTEKRTEAIKELQNFFPLLLNPITGEINNQTLIGREFLKYLESPHTDRKHIFEKYQDFIFDHLLQYYYEGSSDFNKLIVLGEEAKKINANAKK